MNEKRQKDNTKREQIRTNKNFKKCVKKEEITKENTLQFANLLVFFRCYCFFVVVNDFTADVVWDSRVVGWRAHS